MKKNWKWIYAVLAVLVVVGMLFVLGLFEPPFAEETEQPPVTTVTTTTTTAALTEDVVTPGTLTFTGKVVEQDLDSVLMECYDKEKFDTVWVNLSRTGTAAQVGEEYRVDYEDLVMPSLPPRITAVKMTLVSATSSFITEAQAIEIASEYWEVQPGDKDPNTGYVISIHAMELPTAENAKYRMALRWLVEIEGGTGNFSTLDTVYVDAITGEILVSALDVTQ